MHMEQRKRGCPHKTPFELTQVVPFEMVDDVLATTGTTQTRIRDLPSRVVVYLLLAAGLFAESGYRKVWARLVSGLGGPAVAARTSSALAQARRRIDVKPLAALFTLIAGPAAAAERWRGSGAAGRFGTCLPHLSQMSKGCARWPIPRGSGSWICSASTTG
ncbi:transposase domain-containing protein [Micromonospora sp. NBC_00821]|uniref:transposase domain-containing protein n=1 Tax=Micromonospora sp. NBC_00821 TaxID=2975977 RepID=UPI002ED46178